jgi:hypothetical protein
MSPRRIHSSCMKTRLVVLVAAVLLLPASAFAALCKPTPPSLDPAVLRVCPALADCGDTESRYDVPPEYRPPAGQIWECVDVYPPPPPLGTPYPRIDAQLCAWCLYDAPFVGPRPECAFMARGFIAFGAIPDKTYVPHVFTCAPGTTGWFTPEAKAFFEKASATLGLTAAATVLLAKGASIPSIKGALATAANYQAVLAAGFKLLTIDPPDPNFKVFAPVTPDVLVPIVPVAATISAKQATALNAWIDNMNECGALIDAMRATMDRAQGAVNAGNIKWFDKQVLYYNTLQTDLADRLAQEAGLRAAFAALPIKQFPAAFITNVLTPTPKLTKAAKFLRIL